MCVVEFIAHIFYEPCIWTNNFLRTVLTNNISSFGKFDLNLSYDYFIFFTDGTIFQKTQLAKQVTSRGQASTNQQPKS